MTSHITTLEQARKRNEALCVAHEFTYKAYHNHQAKTLERVEKAGRNSINWEAFRYTQDILLERMVQLEEESSRLMDEWDELPLLF